MIEDLAETQPPPRHRRSDPALFFISALLTVSAGAAVLAVIQLLNRPSANAPMPLAERLDAPQNVFGAYGRPRPTPSSSAVDDGSNMTGEARSAVNAVLLDAPANVSARRIPPSPPLESSLNASLFASERSMESAWLEPPPSEKEAIGEAVGAWTPAAAQKVGSNLGMLFFVGEKLFQHPIALKFVLDNPLLVKAAMSQDFVKQRCASAQAFKQYAMDAGNKTSYGVSKALDVLLTSTRYPGATKAILQSELVTTAISQCPSVPMLAADPTSLAQIFASNPNAVAAVSDPRVYQALRSNSAANGYFNQIVAAQASLTH